MVAAHNGDLVAAAPPRWAFARPSWRAPPSTGPINRQTSRPSTISMSSANPSWILPSSSAADRLPRLWNACLGYKDGVAGFSCCWPCGERRACNGVLSGGPPFIANTTYGGYYREITPRECYWFLPEPRRGSGRPQRLCWRFLEESRIQFRTSPVFVLAAQ